MRLETIVKKSYNPNLIINARRRDETRSDQKVWNGWEIERQRNRGKCELKRIKLTRSSVWTNALKCFTSSPQLRAWCWFCLWKPPGPFPSKNGLMNVFENIIIIIIKERNTSAIYLQKQKQKMTDKRQETIADRAELISGNFPIEDEFLCLNWWAFALRLERSSKSWALDDDEVWPSLVKFSWSSDNAFDNLFSSSVSINFKFLRSDWSFCWTDSSRAICLELVGELEGSESWSKATKKIIKPPKKRKWEWSVWCLEGIRQGIKLTRSIKDWWSWTGCWMLK